MQYEVEIEGKSYFMNVRKNAHKENSPLLGNGTALNNRTETGADISYELVREEYDYCLHRSEKLDNKIYILLTVCAFLIGVVMGIVDDLFKIMWPKKILCVKNVVERAVWIGSGVELLIFIISVIILVLALRTIDIYRFDQTEVLVKDMVYESKNKVTKYVCSIYAKCTQHNNDIISKRYKLSNIAIVLIAVGFVIMIILRIMINFMVR